jgi:hypothetical protein
MTLFEFFKEWGLFLSKKNLKQATLCPNYTFVAL